MTYDKFLLNSHIQMSRVQWLLILELLASRSGYWFLSTYNHNIYRHNYLKIPKSQNNLKKYTRFTDRHSTPMKLNFLPIGSEMVRAYPFYQSQIWKIKLVGRPRPNPGLGRYWPKRTFKLWSYLPREHIITLVGEFHCVVCLGYFLLLK